MHSYVSSCIYFNNRWMIIRNDNIHTCVLQTRDCFNCLNGDVFHLWGYLIRYVYWFSTGSDITLALQIYKFIQFWDALQDMALFFNRLKQVLIKRDGFFCKLMFFFSLIILFFH